MGLEAGSYVDDLVVTNPVGASDAKAQGDDHLRLIKTVLKNTFPGLVGRMSRVQGKSSNYTVVANDNTTLLLFSGTTWTLSFTAAATLGNGHMIFYYNGASGNITFDPNGSENINGATTLVIGPGQVGAVFCDGVAFWAFVIPSLSAANTWTAIQTFNSANVHAAVETWQKQQYFPTATLTDAASITWDLDVAQVAKVTLGGNRTLANPSNMKDGGHHTLHIIQDGTGGRTLAFGANYKWPAGSAPTVTSTAGARDIISFVSDGTNMYGNIVQDVK